VEKLVFKIKITVLWLFFAVAMSAARLLIFIEPGVIEGVMRGELPGGKQVSAAVSVMFALSWLIPLIMAFLTLVLKDTANRWTNFVLGILVAVLDLYDIIALISRGELSLGLLLLGLSMIVVPALIAWFAWKWPKAEA